MRAAVRPVAMPKDLAVIADRLCLAPQPRPQVESDEMSVWSRLANPAQPATAQDAQADMATGDAAPKATTCPCFTPGTLIATPRGAVPVEHLREGDLVSTRDNGPQVIRWLGRQTLNRAALATNLDRKPILILAGSLGDGLPERDMIVSPEHRMLIADGAALRNIDAAEVLVAARHLVNHGTIRSLDTMRVTYLHFMFDRHEVVLSDGVWTESFHPSDTSLGAVGEAAAREIATLFPDLGTAEGVAGYAAARQSLSAEEARLLAL